MSKAIPFGKLSARMLKFWVKADLTGREWLAFMALHSNAEWGGKVFQKQIKLAASIGLDPSNFAKVLKRLEAVGVIKRHKGFIQISPQVMEYGDFASASQRKARQQNSLNHSEAGAETNVSLPDSPGADHVGDTPQRRAIPFPKVKRQSGQTSRKTP